MKPCWGRTGDCLFRALMPELVRLIVTERAFLSASYANQKAVLMVIELSSAEHLAYCQSRLRYHERNLGGSSSLVGGW